ncbi:MAG: HD domain-containing protein [Lachnospiraceae bacterium]|nr:HD domain-containing protein [Lachnospiraceae bacterium]
MIVLFYVCVFIVSITCTGIYVYLWHKHCDVNFTMIFTLVPIACLGYVLYSVSDNLGEALAANKIIYIGGCFLQLFILFSIYNLCRIEIRKWLRTALFFACAVLYTSILSTGYQDSFYKSIRLERLDGSVRLVKEYGYMHSVFYALVIAFFIAGLAAIGYSLHRKSQIPRKILYLLVLPDVFCVGSYFAGRIFMQNIEFVPLGYVLAEIVYLLIVYRVNLYDVSDTVIDSMVREKQMGCISVDFEYRYLGSNETARQLVPELKTKALDEMFGYKPAERKIRHYLDSFKQDEKNDSFLYRVEGKEDPEDYRIYHVNAGYLYDGTRRRGYMVTFTDDTANQKYIGLLDSYNEKLQQEVEDKTRHIVEMHDNLIMSLAMMVESRDNSTGGHIKRTSEGVRILTDEMIADGTFQLSGEFCRAVVKAAPMHDLGKIAVDDAILRKAGKFTDEEYEKMKHHAAEGARVIHEILLNTEDDFFRTIAENVAHYHHERWDGSGYPEGLAAENIPIEARIMAIADVYDALVSKRVYKEAFSFEKAEKIISEGMGTQFDPGLKDIFEKARPRLEEYYANSLQAKG